MTTAIIATPARAAATPRDDHAVDGRTYHRAGDLARAHRNAVKRPETNDLHADAIISQTAKENASGARSVSFCQALRPRDQGASEHAFAGPPRWP